MHVHPGQSIATAVIHKEHPDGYAQRAQQSADQHSETTLPKELANSAAAPRGDQISDNEQNAGGACSPQQTSCYSCPDPIPAFQQREASGCESEIERLSIAAVGVNDSGIEGHQGPRYDLIPQAVRPATDHEQEREYGEVQREIACDHSRQSGLEPEDLKEGNGGQRKQRKEAPVGTVSLLVELRSFIVARPDDAGIPTAIKLAEVIGLAWVTFKTTVELRSLERLCVCRSQLPSH